jgi:hypothetical protein
MTFDPHIAAQIIKIHDLAPNTLKVWASRGSIPKKYFDMTGAIIQTKFEAISEDDKYRIMAVYRDCDNLNFNQFQSISVSRFSDLMNGKAAIMKHEYIAFKIEIVDLKNKCNPVFKAKLHIDKVRALKNFLKDPRIKPYTLHQNKYIVECLLDLNRDLEIDDTEQIIINLALMFQSLVL